MVTFLVPIELHVTGDHLLFGDVFENQEIRLVLVVKVIRSCRLSLVEEALPT